MGFITGRCFVLGICVLQVIATAERQIFDFLGYMWVPIIANFFQIIFVIFGFFGTYQYRPKYLIMYITWTVIWLAWNIFVVCLYLEIGSLKKDSNILNMGTGSRSWWEVNGVGCNAKYNVSSITENGWSKPVAIDDCILNYEYVEVVHAGTQILLGLMGLIGACYLVQSFTQEDDSFDFIGGFDSYSTYHPTTTKTAQMQLQPIFNNFQENGHDYFPARARKQIPALPYSIEYRQPTPQTQENSYQRPMTPRRVKRRSTRSKRAAHSHRQSYYQNPVTRIMNRSTIPTHNQPRVAAAAAAGGESSTSNDSYSNLPPPSYSSGHSAPPSYSSAASCMNILGLNAIDLHAAAEGGIVNPSYQSRPSSHYVERPSPIYMNDNETVI